MKDIRNHIIACYQLIRKLLFRPVISGVHENKFFVLDHLHFENAKLIGCDLLYGGGKLIIINSTFDGSHGYLGVFGKAANTLQWLKELDGQDCIKLTFPKSFQQSFQAKSTGESHG